MKIGILTNNQSPATDAYRTVHPFSLLGHETVIIDPSNPKWYDMHQCTVLVASRPNGLVMHNLLTEFKRMGKGKRVIVDMDDNLHELQPSNPAYSHFNQQAVKDSVVACLNVADHIIYSTHALSEYYTRMHPNTKSTIIHNAVDFNITPLQEPRPINNPVRVLWRGSEHHKADLETIRPFWDWILKQTGYEVLFMGLQPHDVHAYFPGAKCVPWQPSPFAFWQKQASLKADVGIFPLEHHLFNLAKSNIFALEMLTNGVLPIVPAGFSEFDHDGVRQYENVVRLIQFMRDIPEDRRIKNIQRGQKWLIENRNLAVVNEKRRGIIEGL